MVVERKPAPAALQQSEIFESLTQAQMTRLLGIIERLDLPKHQILFSAGMPTNLVYFIERGSIRLTRPSPDKQSVVILSLVGPGDILADSLWQLDVHECCAETIEECIVYQLPQDCLQDFMKENPDFARDLIQALGARLIQAERRIEDLIFRQVPSRVAKLFINLAENHGKVTAAGIVLSLPLTHQEIADTVGSSRVTITQILNRFRASGWIGIKYKRVTIRNMDALEELVTSDVHTRKRFRGSAVDH